MRNFKLSLSSICFLLILVFLIVYGSIKHDAESGNFVNNSNFVTQNTKVNRVNSKEKIFIEKIIPTQEKSVHASAIVKVDNALMVLFFGGSGEGKRDVKIYQSFFNLSSNASNEAWTKPNEILNTELLAKMTGKYIKTIGNPVIFKDGNNKIHVFVVATNLGGWATSKIYQFHFNDDLKKLIFSQELKLSPFMNFSHLVRTPGIALQNGGFMLPLYHELATKFSLVSFFDSNAKLVFTKQMNNAKALIQPTITSVDAESCLASFRVYNNQYDSAQLVQKCGEKGNQWKLPLIKSNLKNDDNSSVMVRFEKGFLLIHNDADQNPILNKILNCKNYFEGNSKNPYLDFAEIKKINLTSCTSKDQNNLDHTRKIKKYSSRQSLSLFYLNDEELNKESVNFKRLATIDITTFDGEVSYPAALLDSQFLHITYTHDRKNIKYVALSTAKINELINNVNNDDVLLSEGIK